jgi:hypothetical protein
MPNVDETDKEPQAISVAKLSHRRSDQFATIYTNTAGLGANFYDLQLIFGRIVHMHKDEVEGPGPYIEDLASVSMSWEHAKALTVSLNKTIGEYEKDNGPIRMSGKTP